MIDASTRLRRAILLNDVDLVRRLVRLHPDLLRNPDFGDKSNTSLHLAAAHGHEAIAAHLLDAGHEGGATVSRNTAHETALMLAARGGHVAVAALLIRRCPASIAAVDAAGRDALAAAAMNPASTALIPLLLAAPECPASVLARDADGNTALHHASAAGSLKALRVLLAAGADPLAKNHYDWTPLAYSQTVAAEVYFKNLAAEFERRKVEGAKLEEERERQRAAGVRLVGEDSDEGGEVLRTPVDDEERISDALQRHWTPVERKMPSTPGSSGKVHEWEGRPLMQLRTRSASGTTE